jgi:cytochrome c oxidase subunit 2
MLSLALLATLVATSGCSWDETKRLALPEAASDRAPIIYDVWIGFWAGAAVIGVLVWGLIAWVCTRYRRRSDEEVPPQTRYNLPLEILYTAAPFIIILVLFFHTVTSQNEVLAEDGAEHEVRVVAQKWSWAFNYLEEGVFEIGTPAEPADLWLPVDEVVGFRLESSDVIHGFWVPEFYFKQDVFPGVNENYFEVTPTREGVFRGRCTELCGMYHSRMIFDVHIVPRDEYEAHIEELRAAGQVGDPRGASDDDDVAGLDDIAEGD